jgi:hypothetical protein
MGVINSEVCLSMLTDAWEYSDGTRLCCHCIWGSRYYDAVPFGNQTTSCDTDISLTSLILFHSPSPPLKLSTLSVGQLRDNINKKNELF